MFWWWRAVAKLPRTQQAFFSGNLVMLRFRYLPWLVGLVLLGGAAAALAAPVAEEIQQAVERLGSGRQAVREQASRELWEAGLAAEAALRRAAESSDAEVRYRARAILEKFKFGLFPDTPPEVSAGIRQFQDGDSNTRFQVLQQLQAKGHLRTVLVLLKAEEDDRLRKMYLATPGLDANGLLPYLLRQGDFAQAEEWLGYIAETDAGAGAFAAYWLMRGKLDERVAALREELSKGLDTRVARNLTYLLRAKGDWLAARAVAEQAGDPALLKAVLVELHDWAEISQRHEQRRPPGNIRPAGSGADIQALYYLGYAAAFQRLADNADAMTATLAEITALAKKNPENLWHGTKGLLINDRPDEAIALIRKECPAIAFGLLAYQHRYREAFELAGLSDGRVADRQWFLSLPTEMASRAPKRVPRYEFALEVARLLYVLGQRDESQKLFALLAEIAQETTGDKSTADNPWLALATVEFKIGLNPPAFDHAARAIEKAGPRPVLDKLFGTRASEAEVWWQFFLRQQPGEPATATLPRVFHVLRWINANDDMPPLAERSDDEFRKLVAVALQAATELEEKDRLAWRLGMGETSVARNQNELARSCFQAAAEISAEAAVRLADVYFLDQDWREAARWYRRAWEMDAQQLIALFMAGRSLQRAGQVDAGRELVQQANLLAIGSRTRQALAKGLGDRELTEDAMEQWSLILRTQPTSTTEPTEPARRLAVFLQKKDKLRTADMWERVILSNLEWGWYFNEEESYLRVPAFIHRYRAHGLVEAGKFDAAKREIELSRAAAPTDVSLAEDVVPALEQAGRKQDADELFDKMFATLDQLSQDWPNSGWHHNDLAWLAARCHRRLDEAFAHAQRAVELAPHNAGYLDTLAEAHFHLGHREAAIECSQKCLTMSPRLKIYQEQLARFRNDPLP